MSKFPLFNRLRGGGDKEEEATPIDPDAAETTKEEEDALKEESRIMRVFELSRNYFIQERLIGDMYFSYSFLAFGNSISCDIDGTDPNEQIVPHDEASLGTFEKAVLGATKRAIRNLTNRALAYRNKPYKENLSLGCQVALTMPMMGLASFYMTCNAKVHTLLEAHDRRSTTEGGKKH